MRRRMDKVELSFGVQLTKYTGRTIDRGSRSPLCCELYDKPATAILSGSSVPVEFTAFVISL
jgi:hypothetical protein